MRFVQLERFIWRGACVLCHHNREGCRRDTATNVWLWSSRFRGFQMNLWMVRSWMETRSWSAIVDNHIWVDEGKKIFTKMTGVGLQSRATRCCDLFWYEADQHRVKWVIMAPSPRQLTISWWYEDGSRFWNCCWRCGLWLLSGYKEH